MVSLQAIAGTILRWLGAYGFRSLCFALAGLLSAAMIFWIFRLPLEPVLGFRAETAVPFVIGSWHWIAAWFALWFLVSAGIVDTVGQLRGAVFSGGLAMLTGAGAWISDEAGLADLTSPATAASPLMAFWSGWLLVQFARLHLRMPAPQARARPNKENLQTDADGNDLIEQFFCAFASLTGLSLFAGVRLWPDTTLDDRVAVGDQFVASLVFTVLILTSFLPLLSGFWIKAKRETADAGRQFWRDNVISPMSFAIIAGAVAGITVLAFAAAAYASETISTAISYATFAGVFLLFSLVIVLPHITNYFRRRREEQIPVTPMGIASLDLPAQWLSYFDTLLVRVIAPMSGGTQRHFSHFHVIGLLGLLSLLGLMTPRPFGLVPVVLGILLVVALGRRWAWVEADRETASRLARTRSSNIHLGFEKDLKDEALTGYAGLFILVPLTLYQIQDLTNFIPPLREQQNILLTWIAFFGGELAKAVPFVDWWDIYGNSELSPNGKHLTFLSRAAVDLVILSALFQALSIWQRDQVQTRLFRDGHLDAFDPFKEREFFERGIVHIAGELPNANMSPSRLAEAEKFESRLDLLRRQKRLAVLDERGTRLYFEVRPDFEDAIKRHVAGRRKLLRESSNIYESPAPYSRDRLSELIKSSQSDILRAGATWMIMRWDVLVGSPQEQLGQIALRWVQDKFPTVPQKNREEHTKYIRTQKMSIEQILVALASKPWADQINQGDVSKLMQCLVLVAEEVEFDFTRILSFELLGNLKTEYAVLFLSKFVLQGADLERRDRWRLRMIAVAEGPDTRLRAGRFDMRERVYDAVSRIACNPRAGDRARRSAYELLVWMGTDDGARSGQARASTLAAAAARHLEDAGLLSEQAEDSSHYDEEPSDA